jgi:hypothetical protein
MSPRDVVRQTPRGDPQNGCALAAPAPTPTVASSPLVRHLLFCAPLPSPAALMPIVGNGAAHSYQCRALTLSPKQRNRRKNLGEFRTHSCTLCYCWIELDYFALLPSTPFCRGQSQF